jgi:hypothetical protein
MDRGRPYTLDLIKFAIKKLDVSQTQIGIDLILHFLSLQKGSGILGADVSGCPQNGLSARTRFRTTSGRP